MVSTPRAETSFDHNSLDWLAARHHHNDELRAKCPVIWNESHGGYWYVSGHEAVGAVARDMATFSSRYEPSGIDGLSYIGIMGIPRNPGNPKIGIAEAEKRVHTALRRTMNPYLLPNAVRRDLPFLEQAATWFLDQKAEAGAMEVIHDFAGPVPALWTMRLLDLPPSRWEHFAEVFHATAAYGPDQPEFRAALARIPEMRQEMTEIIDGRRRKPGDDLLSKLVVMDVDGATLSTEELVGVLWNLIGGGLDTTTSLTALALHHLDQDEALRTRLREHPDLLVRACEEYLRWTSVNETLTRTCTRDTELAGQQLKRGDYVMVSWLGANFDPDVFDRPGEIDIDRDVNPHLAFGVGPQRCVGLHIARAMFVVMMKEMLSRMPDYQVDQAQTRFYSGNPELHGIVSMPVTFTPSAPLGAPSPF
jgi:cytochrome P450